MSFEKAVLKHLDSIKYVLPALCPGDPELDYHNLESTTGNYIIR